MESLLLNECVFSVENDIFNSTAGCRVWIIQRNCCHSNERLFLKDFVFCSPGTSGERLARWLQPDSFVDPTKCEVSLAKDDIRCGWPATVTISTRDQYGEIVIVPGLKIVVKAIPIDSKDIVDSNQGKKNRRISQPDPMTFGGHSQPSMEKHYEVTVNNKMCFYAITIMKAYQNYSFEELRFASPAVRRSCETMLVRQNQDGTYNATWTPSSVGWYSLMITIDGYAMDNVYKMEVKEPPKGIHPPAQSIVTKPQHQPSRLRKFVAKNSAGLRVRTHPSLQSEQIGIIPVQGTVIFAEEIRNDDGIWLRLTAETIKDYCNIFYQEAWCLGYNQHIGKTLLLSIEGPKLTVNQVAEEEKFRKESDKICPPSYKRKTVSRVDDYLTESGETMVVITSGASGHNIRSRPSLEAAPVGMLTLGDKVTIQEYWVNEDGTWVRMNDESVKKYCFSENEAWSLAINKHGVTYMEVKKNSKFDCEDKEDSAIDDSKKKIDFSGSSGDNDRFNFTAEKFVTETANSEVANPFIFGSLSHQGSHDSVKFIPKKYEISSKISKLHCKEKEHEVGGKFNILHKWLRGDDKEKSNSASRDFSEFVGVSVKELVKAIGESRINGNGATPPETPQKLSRSSSPKNGPGGSPKFDSHSSSPILIPLSEGIVDSTTSQRFGSTQSDTSAVASSLTRDPSQSPSGISSAAYVRDLSPSPSCSSFQMKSGGSIASLPATPIKYSTDTEDVQKMSQAQTQTSPDISSKSHFSIRSPNQARRDQKPASARSKRSISPVNAPSNPSFSRSLCTKDKPKTAISPSVAECLRAVFAAFLWHEGIVHDAMACASFLKFHPTLPKHGTPVITRQPPQHRRESKIELTKEEKSRQRHSVEVSNAGNYLHIQPSTLETLTRSAVNANANRNRKKQEINLKDEINSKLTSLPECQTVAILPPALKCLVFLWEEIHTLCLQAIEHNLILASPNSQILKVSKKNLDKSRDKDKKANRKKKEWGKGTSKPTVEERTGDPETTCELCGLIFSHPVTYHMKTMHPGCGWQSGGMGYNNVGSYCSGWAGNCGDSDFGGTCWYLICDSCRDKYLKTRKNKFGKKLIGIISRKKGKNVISPILSPGNTESHLIMKNNAMFLLELSSSASGDIPKQQRRTSATLSSVAENSSPPDASPFPPTGTFQYLTTMGISGIAHSANQFIDEELKYENYQTFTDDNQNTSSTPSDCPTSDNNLEGLKFRGIFHRSISMSTGAPWAGNDGSIVTTRKRNNSSVERNNENGSSLLCFTSPQLQKLVPSMDQSAIISTEKDISNNDRLDILTRPVLSFVLQQHNLQQLQLAMKHALRLAACRVYAMQAFNWLLKSVTQSVCLHDLLWWFVASLTSTPDLQEYDENVKSNKKDESDITGICEHPLSDLVIAGEALHPLTSVFHNLLQTIADLMLLPPPGSPLQQAAIRCWGIKFTPADHMFLHRSHVFSNISKILSRSEEEEDMTISTHEAHQLNNLHMPGPVMTLKDFTSNLNIKASSRQAMIGHLTDNSTETFWESGDEDRNKAKTITITCPADNIPKMIYIHIDNCRDLAHKVFSVSFYSGVNIDEMVKLRTIEIESRSASWVSSSVLDPTHNVLLLELKGPDNSLRIRQIRILGIIEGESMKIQNQLSFVTIQQRNCEAETLKVFRLITSQVFGKLIQGDQQKKHQEKLNLDIEQSNDLEDSHDLREHMVGILFSQRKLTHLQKQVCTHIVQSIRSETIRLHDEWENLLCSPTSVNGISLDSSEPLKPSDTYCFEMLSMVLALSGSSVGRNYLSHQVGLLKDLLSLLHTGSARIQRQVASLLRRILPAISPDSLANVLDVPKLPPTDFSTVSAVNSNYSSTHNFDMYVAGILDVFLSCIAKSLSLQVKIKGKENGKNIQTISLATSIHPKNFYGTRWWLRGTMTRKLAEVIIQLLKDMASGELNEAWASVTKAAIAENILNLTRLDEKSREPTECLKTPTVWLALSSLCVLDSDHVERLSSGQWNTIDGQTVPPRPICSNHDDGETTAMIQCNTCGNLCAECDRIMHLHRRTRLHVRQVCKEEEKAIRVDLHEGCGRIKLFWVLALADSRTLKALVEFRDGTTNKNVGATSGICRFCGTTGNTGLLAISNICSDHECQEYAKNACNKTHPCGHICGGVRNEKNCLPCLQRCQTDVELKQDADDMCMICFTEALSCAPAIQLTCGHIFHFHCCKSVLMKRWVGPRITFGFSLCPICKMSMIHPGLSDLLEEIKVIFADVRRKALMRLEYEGLHKSEAVTTSGGRYYQDPTAYAMDRYAYYICYKCQKAYYGGEARCDAQLGGESFDPTELVCGACSDVARAQMCPKHGADFLEYKCRYCCSTAVFFCFGTTHFCNPCHDDFQRVTNIPKSDLPSCPAGPKGRKLESDDCPLHVKHPPTGEEFALGCGICRNAHTF